MTRAIPHRNLPQLLLRARESLMGHFRPILTHFGLTEQQWRILRTVGEHEQLEPRELCEICQILSPSLTGVLSRMEDLALVTRTRMEEDQRRVLVRLTPKAETLVAQIAPLVEAQYHIIEMAYGQEMLAELYEMMDRFLSAEHSPIGQVDLPEQRDKANAPQ